MKPRDWLLLFLYVPSSKSEGPPPAIDPVRVMKGMFLMAQEGNLSADQNYHFVPYSYGPCSFDIYDDLRVLQHGGLVQSEHRLGMTWSYYRLTQEGAKRAHDLVGKVEKDKLSSLETIKELVTSKRFLELLRFVYKKYPEYATASVINP